jgi:hypothetical protein
VLLWFDTRLASGILTEAQEAADLVAKLGHRLKITHISLSDTIVERYIYNGYLCQGLLLSTVLLAEVIPIATE